jgi:phage terminase large subunit
MTMTILPQELLTEWADHPARMVREVFGVEPDHWQEQALEAFPHCQRLAMKACKGPGKTTVLAWLAWNFLATRPNPKIGAISVTNVNLADGLWAEMAKWQKRSKLLQSHFTWTKTRIFRNSAPEEWFMSAKSYSQSADREQQANALAGFHADYVLFLIDESGAMSDAVLVSAEAALSSCVEGHIVQAGNPLKLEGPLHRACVTSKQLWRVVEITGDPDDQGRSPRISIEHAREQIAQYGRNNPWVLVNIFGQFPPSSINALIGPDEVAAAMKRSYRDYEIGRAPKVLGVDVAQYGDDASVIAARQGIQCLPFLKYRNIDSTQGAGQVASKWTDWGADAVFIDATGGFGAGWIDQLRNLGKSPIGIHFAGQAHDASRCVNKRAEMYFDAIEWIKRGGALPQSDELIATLTQTTYTFKGDRLLLEPKDEIRIKLGYSPDEADALVLTFAEPVTPHAAPLRKSRSAVADYNPFADLDRDASWHMARDHESFAGNSGAS